MNTLKSRLKSFKLSGMLSSLETRLKYAEQKTIGYTELLELLCEDEINNRLQNSYKKRYYRAKFPAKKR